MIVAVMVWMAASVAATWLANRWLSDHRPAEVRLEVRRPRRPRH